VSTLVAHQWLTALVVAVFAGFIAVIMSRLSRRVLRQQQFIEREMSAYKRGITRDAERLRWLAQRQRGPALEQLADRAASLELAYEDLSLTSSKESVQRVLEAHNRFVQQLRLVEASLTSQLEMTELLVEDLRTYREGLRNVVQGSLHDALDGDLDPSSLGRSLALSWATSRTDLVELREQLTREIGEITGTAPLLEREVSHVIEHAPTGPHRVAL
jgi:uncharacterized membrane-anchored protein YhcB (DUF1043 family)